MASDPENALVSTEWLAAHLDAPDIRVIDASWYLPEDGRDPRAEYDAAHIPDALFFDVDEIADLDSGLPHMLPSAEKFTSRVRRLGLGDGNRIIVYDGGGVRSSARAWWMFKVFGHDDVAVLDGGFGKWVAEGRPVDDLPPIPRERHFTARKNHVMVRLIDQVWGNIDSAHEQLVDARGPGRFSGTEPEPREGMRSGHIPGALNLHYAKLFKRDGTMLRGDDLRAAFVDAGLELDRPIVTTCGSGITASVLALGLHLLGHRETAVYDGAWCEWGGRDDTPVATGG